MADRQPRPGLAVLLAGRFRVSRPALLARPGGPVAGVDVATGAGVRVQLAPPDVDDAELRRRIARANALGRPGCALVEVAEDPPARWLAVHPPDGAVALADAAADARLAAQASALGAALDAASLGLAEPARALAVVDGEPCLLEPAVAAADPASPLAAAFADAVAARVGEGGPRPAPAARTTEVGLTERLGLDRLRAIAGSGPRLRLAVALAAAAAVVGGYAATARIGGAAGAGRTGTTLATPTRDLPAATTPRSAAAEPVAHHPTAAQARGGTARPHRTPAGPRGSAGVHARDVGAPPGPARGSAATALPWPAPTRSTPTAPGAPTSPAPRRRRWRAPAPPAPSVCQSAGFCT
jgi:hypothetical protein